MDRNQKLACYRFWKIGTPNRVRTCDLLIKSQLLYQLSYGRAEVVHLVEALSQVNGVLPLSVIAWYNKAQVQSEGMIYDTVFEPSNLHVRSGLGLRLNAFGAANGQ